MKFDVNVPYEAIGESLIDVDPEPLPIEARVFHDPLVGLPHA